MAQANAFQRLKRSIQPLPANIRRLLTQRDLMSAYRSRPGYQQNDYLMWIAKAKRDATKDKRTTQMLDELTHGGVYMNMRWSAGPSTHPAAKTSVESRGAAKKKSATKAAKKKSATKPAKKSATKPAKKKSATRPATKRNGRV